MSNTGKITLTLLDMYLILLLGNGCQGNRQCASHPASRVDYIIFCVRWMWDSTSVPCISIDIVLHFFNERIRFIHLQFTIRVDKRENYNSYFFTLPINPEDWQHMTPPPPKKKKLVSSPFYMVERFNCMPWNDCRLIYPQPPHSLNYNKSGKL